MTQDRSTIWPEYLSPLIEGGVAGLVATGPMTAFMVVAHRYLPPWHRSSLPPKKLTMHLANLVGLKKHMNEPQRQTATWIAHFAYGTAGGAIYGPLARKIPLPAPVTGPAFGLLVWAASYLVGIPLLGMPDAALDQPKQRNALMIGAHLAWGTVLGLVTAALASRRNP